MIFNDLTSSFNLEIVKKRKDLIDRKENVSSLQNGQVEDFALSVLENQTMTVGSFGVTQSTYFFGCIKDNEQAINPTKKSKKKREHLREYAIPKLEPTPEKYYPFTIRDEKILCKLSPGLKEKIKGQGEGLGDERDFVYSIKHTETNRRYIGVSCDPRRRLSQHLKKAVDERQGEPQGGHLYSAIAKSPEKFCFGLIDIPLKKEIDPALASDFFEVQGIGAAEKHCIQLKQSLFHQNGYNGNSGGGGPIGKSSRKKKEKLDHSTGDAQPFSAGEIEGSSLSFDND